MGKLVTHQQMTARKMSAILGSIIALLMAMHFLRAFTDHLVQFVKLQRLEGWDRKLDIPLQLQNQVKELSGIMEKWKGRTFQGKATVR